MKIKPVAFQAVKASALANPDVNRAYLLEKREEELQELLAEMRAIAGINSTQVAERMGVSQPSISRLEKNVTKASFSTLERYALACGVSLKVMMEC